MRFPYYLIVLVEIWGGVSLSALWGIWYRYRQEVKEVEVEEKCEHVWCVIDSDWKHRGPELEDWTVTQVLICESCQITREEVFDSRTFNALPISPEEEE